jgi:hypothetical protein
MSEADRRTMVGTGRLGEWPALGARSSHSGRTGSQVQPGPCCRGIGRTDPYRRRRLAAPAMLAEPRFNAVADRPDADGPPRQMAPTALAVPGGLAARRPASCYASFTSSSLKGLMLASIFFMCLHPWPAPKPPKDRTHELGRLLVAGAVPMSSRAWKGSCSNGAARSATRLVWYCAICIGDR